MDICDLGVVSVLQETCTTCGPAVARMTLGPNAPQENVLFPKILDFMKKQPNPCFVTSPEALADVLGSIAKIPFRVERRGTLEEVDKIIVNALLDQKVPVPVVVRSCQHWIIASGFVYSSDTTGAVQVADFIINDPNNICLDCNRNGVIAPICSQGGFSAAGADGVPAAEWRQRWLTGCGCQQANKEFICVVPASATDGPRDVSELVIPGPDFGRPIEMGDLDVCLEYSVRVYALSRHKAFEKALAGANVRKAAMVNRDTRAYFLTEVGTSEGVTALFLFDRETGSLISARALETTVTKFLPESIEETKNNIRNWRNRAHSEKPLEEELIEYPLLRWESSREFGSPYFPFMEIGGEADRVFLGINGVAYRYLREARA